MRIGKISLAAIAVVTMAGAPVLAQATATKSAVSRASVEASDENNIQGGSGILIGLLALGALIGGIIVATGNDDDTPVSP